MRYLQCAFLLLIAGIVPAQTQDNPSESPKRPGSPFNQSRFVPDISMIVDFAYVSRNIDNDRFSMLSLHGLGSPFVLSQGNDGSNANRGFNLNYGEMSVFSIVDPYFDLSAILHFAPEHAALEEAYITTRKLPYGFQLKAGKFLSSIGRVNEQHEHSLDFAERPLVLHAFFGGEGLNELGARITWVAPTDIYLMLGTEILTGENEASFGTTGFSDQNGLVYVHESEGPHLFVSYARSSFDIEDAAVLCGISYGHGKTRMDDHFSVSDGEGIALDASTDIVAANLTVKYLVDAVRNVSFQSEYMYRVTKGSMFSRDTSFSVNTDPLEKRQAGFYCQLVATLGIRWRAGIRYDLLNLNNVMIGNTDQRFPNDLARYSAMVEYNPTEFSRLRLQFNHDRSKYLHTANGLIDQAYSEAILQLNIAIGAHAAHSF